MKITHVTAGILVVLASFLGAQSSQNLSLHDQVPYPVGTCADLWLDGDRLFVARRGEGFAIFDISDRTDLVPIWSGRAELFIQDIKTRGNLAICSNESGNGQAIYIFDVSNPAAPVQVSSFGSLVLPTCNNLVVRGNTIYAGCVVTGIVSVIDISNPSMPQEVGSFGSSYPIALFHDIAEVDGRLYVSWLSGGFDVRDAAANPANPPLLYSKQVPTSLIHNAYPLGSGQYVATTDEVSGGYLRIWDVSNPLSITEAATWRASPIAVMHDLRIVDHLAFITNYTEGLRVVDLRNPLNPVEIAHYDTFTGANAFTFGAWGVFPYDRDTVYVADFSRGVFAFDLSPVTTGLTASTATYNWGETIALTLSGQNTTTTDLPVYVELSFTVQELGPGSASLIGVPLLLPSGVLAQGPYFLPLPSPGPAGPFHVTFTLSASSASDLLLYDAASVTVTIQ